jgi:crotonobetainyl-CoA:carnitine CoA-transferase CaiB-like acyl-CoA transferase
MTKVMQGVRVLEVAQFTFVPAAGAILTGWGADVIKIEHPCAATPNAASSTWAVRSPTPTAIRWWNTGRWRQRHSGPGNRSDPARAHAELGQPVEESVHG